MFIPAFRGISHWSLPRVRKIYGKNAIFFQNHFNITLPFTIHKCVIEMASIVQVSLQKFCMHFFTLLRLLRSAPFSPSLIWLPQWYLSTIKNYEAPHYATICNFLLLCMYASYCWLQILSFLCYLTALSISMIVKNW